LNHIAFTTYDLGWIALLVIIDKLLVRCFYKIDLGNMIIFTWKSNTLLFVAYYCFFLSSSVEWKTGAANTPSSTA
jgi:hypothetical protein